MNRTEISIIMVVLEVTILSPALVLAIFLRVLLIMSNSSNSNKRNVLSLILRIC